MTRALSLTLYYNPCRLGDWTTWLRNDLRDLTALCSEFVGTHYSIEIVHIEEERQRAHNDGVFATPSVLLEMPCGRKQNLGGLAATRAFLQTRHEAQQAPSQIEAMDLK